MKSIPFKYKIYGRKKGRKKNKIDFNQINYKKIFKSDINVYKKNCNILDIGTGNGESSLYLSKLFPNSKIISCETYLDGNLNLYNKIKGFYRVI